MLDEKAFFTLTAGLYIVGCRQNDKNYGCIIDTVMQASFTPPLVCISCEKKAHTQKIIRETGRFSISVLPQDTPVDLINTFGYHSGKDTDKWATVPFKLQDDLPIYSNSISVLTAHVTETKELDTHFLFLGEIDTAQVLNNASALTYQYYREHLLPSACQTSASKKWVCRVCGYVYDEQTPFEELGNDYHCPICGVGKDFFDLKSC